jgi:cell division protein FtsB
MSRTPSIGLTTARYEEVAHYRQELEEAKKENEALRKKIRELERELRGRRSESVETNQSRRGRSGPNENGDSVEGSLPGR